MYTSITPEEHAEKQRKQNCISLVRIPHADQYSGLQQRQRWLYCCTKYCNSNLVRYGSIIDFKLVFYAWQAIDSLCENKTISKNQKLSLLLQLFEGAYS
jgi:hypothetical protein